jgi:hypothetical protein
MARRKNKRIAYFHEDDHCQIQVLPAENWQHCASQLGQIAEFSEKHRTPDGIGWTDILVRQDAPTTLSALAISSTELSRRLAAHLQAFDGVQTGYSTYVVDCKHTRGFGPNDDCAVFYSVDERGNVRDIWLGLAGPPSTEREMLLATLREISSMGKCLLVDWGWKCLFSLADPDAIAAYLIERERVFRD